MRSTLLEIYRSLEAQYGPQHWWPGETRFEIIIGAILTQSAAWTNVEKCIANLKSNNVLSPEALREIPLEQLAELVYPSPLETVGRQAVTGKNLLDVTAGLKSASQASEQPRETRNQEEP